MLKENNLLILQLLKKVNRNPRMFQWFVSPKGRIFFTNIFYIFWTINTFLKLVWRLCLGILSSPKSGNLENYFVICNKNKKEKHFTVRIILRTTRADSHLLKTTLQRAATHFCVVIAYFFLRKYHIHVMFLCNLVFSWLLIRHYHIWRDIPKAINCHRQRTHTVLTQELVDTKSE